MQDVNGSWFDTPLKARLKNGRETQIMIPILALLEVAKRGGVFDRVERKEKAAGEGAYEEYTCRSAHNRGLIGDQIRVRGQLRTWDKQKKVRGGYGDFV